MDDPKYTAPTVTPVTPQQFKTPALADAWAHGWQACLEQFSAHERRAFEAGIAVGGNDERTHGPEIETFDAWVKMGRPEWLGGLAECWLHPVTSSNLSAVGWRSTRLYVKFTSGVVFEYRRVPYDLYYALLTATSKGKFFAAHIRKHPDEFPFRKVEHD